MNIGQRPRTMGDGVNLQFFKCNGTKDSKQYWFLCEAIWTVKQVQDKDIKKGQLVMTFQGHALDWYMKSVQVLTGHHPKTMHKLGLD